MSEAAKIGENLKAHARDELAKRVLTAAAVIAEKMVDNISGGGGKPGWGVSTGQREKHKRPNAKGRKVSSGGGRYPGVRSGKLKRSIVLEFNDVESVKANNNSVRIGINKEAFYGIILQQQGFKGLKDSADEVMAIVEMILEGKSNVTVA